MWNHQGRDIEANLTLHLASCFSCQPCTDCGHRNNRETGERAILDQTYRRA